MSDPAKWYVPKKDDKVRFIRPEDIAIGTAPAARAALEALIGKAYTEDLFVHVSQGSPFCAKAAARLDAFLAAGALGGWKAVLELFDAESPIRRGPSRVMHYGLLETAARMADDDASDKDDYYQWINDIIASSR